MVGNHAVGDGARPFRLDAGQVGDVGDDRAEQIDLVIVVGTLQHRSGALEPHARVDRRFRQIDALAARQLLELHEHQVPDLNEAVALGLGRARWTARDVGAMVVKDFRAGAAGPELAHLPEIIRAGDADDFALGQARDLLPQIERLVVVDENGDYQAIERQAELLGNEIPRKLDGAVLEVITEREIAEHLEEGVMARGIAHIVEIVVLATGAHAFLRGRRARIGPLLETGKDVLELHHSRIGKHQRRVIARHERRRRHDRVTVLREIVEKARSDLVDAAHCPTTFDLSCGSRCF